MMASLPRHSFKCLADLIAWDRPLSALPAGIAVAGLRLDSRLIASDEVFLACKGAVSDGRQFIREAVARGAVAVLAERGEQWQDDSECDGVPVLVVEQLSEKISKIAGYFYANPSKALPLIGVTGTNGKTSCTQLISQLLVALGQQCGVLGTLGSGINGRLEVGLNTTPDALSVQQLLAQWRDASVNLAAMEVSSHGLEQGRVAGLQFQVAVFTNLTRDHLDYHGSMQAYGEAKLKLFQQPGLQWAVVNLDDAFAERVLAGLSAETRSVTYSLKDASADVYANSITYQRGAIILELSSPWGEHCLQTPLLGDFNLSNVLAALAALAAAGYPLSSLVDKCKGLQPVAGRMERVDVGADIDVVVDYAHTPDALKNALQALRAHTKGRLWCVFGCGGDRDQGKRPQMGQVAEQYADCIVVTSDNPRNEKAEDILEDILDGITVSAQVEQDRAKAIALAIAQAEAGDSVLLAGKGHEDYQQFGEQRLPFSDLQQARLALQQRKLGGLS